MLCVICFETAVSSFFSRSVVICCIALTLSCCVAFIFDISLSSMRIFLLFFQLLVASFLAAARHFCSLSFVLPLHIRSGFVYNADFIRMLVIVRLFMDCMNEGMKYNGKPMQHIPLHFLHLWHFSTIAL